MKENEKEIDDQKEDKTPSEREVSQGRRDALKAIATVPVLGAMAYGVYRKKKVESNNRNAAEMFRFRTEVAPYSSPSSDTETIRIGIIGFGIRGTQLMQGLGFATPEYVENLIQQSKINPENSRYQDFMEQDDLRVVITAVCDIFDTYGEEALFAGANIHREGVRGTLGPKPRRYRHYKELLAAADVDAVVIASPDHWHGTRSEERRVGKEC